MDRIVLKNLMFYGYHGVLDEEKRIGQKFLLDVNLYANLRKAGESDDVNDTVHYGEAFELIKQVVEQERYNLIEAVAERICQRIFAKFAAVQEIEVIVKKPAAPVPGIFDYFAVEVRRTRDEYGLSEPGK